MVHVPFIRVTSPDTGQIGPGAFRSPLERMIIDRFRGQRIRAIALYLVPQRPDHLAVTDVAAFADVDVPARKLQRRIWPHTRDLLDRILQIEQRRDFDQTTDGDHDKAQSQQQRGISLDFFMVGYERHRSLRYSAGTARSAAGFCSWAPLTVSQRLITIIIAPAR